MRRLCALLVAVALGACPAPKPPPKPPKPVAPPPKPKGPDVGALKPQVNELMEPVLEGVWVQGMSIGLLSDRGTAVFGYGIAGTGGPAPDGDTVFELGSVTKVLTGVLLGEAVDRKVVGLDALVQYLLPPVVKSPTWQGRPITVGQLATHTSGLPRMPTNFARRDPANPYADYSVDDLYAFLQGYQLPREPGAQYEFSNVGFGLLGHVLSLKQKLGYEELVIEWVCKPLGMTRTTIGLNDEQKTHLAEGHDGDGKAVPLWDMPTLAGAGAFRSTANDMLLLLGAAVGLKRTPLANALALSREPRVPTAVPKGHTGLGWYVHEDGRTVWHSGATGGFRAFVAFDAESKLGVVVLANTSVAMVDDIGFALMGLLRDGTAQALPLPPTVDLEPKVIDRYVGKYKLVSGPVVVVSKEEGQLVLEAGSTRARLYAKSEADFYVRVVDAEVVFTFDAKGKVTALTLKQEGSEQRATRVGR